MSYNSQYTGQEVEQLLEKAGTALQSTDVSEVATSGSYNDLSDKPTIPDISGKQDELVSGINIKTINGNSILGSGDLEIDSSIPVVEVSGTSVALTANQFTILTTVQTSTTLTVTLNAVENDTVYNEYMMQFSTGAIAPTVNFPSSVVWVETPVIEVSKIYQVSIVNNVGLIVGVTDTSSYDSQ